MTPLIRLLMISNLLLVLSTLLLGSWLFILLPEHRPQTASTINTEKLIETTAGAPARSASETPGRGRPSRLDPEFELALRKTIRSELHRFVESMETDPREGRPTPLPATTDETNPTNLQHIEDQRIQHRIVAEELDHLIQQGQITDIEMAALQLEIGKLTPEGRIAAMRRLVSALNSGKLKGQL
ncbi:MAG: hypothetical protein ACPGJE_01145 [Wenzhouxiangellaceae bacterium]